MRILKIHVTGVLRSMQPAVDLGQEPVKAQLFRDLEALRYELGERIRAKAMSYLPPHYAIFVRVTFEPAGNKAIATFWIDDPTVSGVNGLLARRAWKLSTPILSHVVREAFQERLQTFALEVDDSKAKVESFAATRGWYSAPILVLMAIAATSAYWLFAHRAVMALFHP